ncbi:MAG: glycosyltransferase [Nodosilinea sp.]
MTGTAAMDTSFNGRIVQVIEALDYGDAVSTQAIQLDKLLKELGFATALYSKWCHEHVQALRFNLEALQPTESDIVILHYVGYSKHSFPYVKSLHCTKICVYHNITPHHFFEPGTDLYDLCFKGREQLLEVVKSFHYFWGDSSYNLEELIQLGVNPQHCSKVPIVIPQPDFDSDRAAKREMGTWIFLGRIAPNKGQQSLVRLFFEVRSMAPSLAEKLYLVGGFAKTDPYYQRLIQDIQYLNLTEHVVTTGKVSDEDVNYYLSQASVFVSMSEHEGFGVPLIEATYHDLPVIALRNSAIGETMGKSVGLADSPEELKEKLADLFLNPSLRKDLVEQQQENARRFTPQTVKKSLVEALSLVLPEPTRFATVSVVICTYNRANYIERCLEYLQYQTNQSFEVVVINGPSKDKTEEVLRRYAGKIKIGSNPEQNLSISRNLGIELSSGDLIAFIDDDALPFDDWVDTLIQEFSRRPLTFAALGGPVYYAGTLEFQAEDIGINQFAEIEVSIDSKKIGKDGWRRSLLGTNTCFRADSLRDVGGFDEQFDYYLDESELCFRLQSQNHLVGYSPSLFVRHEFAQSSNRSGKYTYNWFSICKNIAYFIAKYSGLEGDELVTYVKQRIHLDRISSLQAARSAGGISQRDYDQFLADIEAGVSQGLVDAKSPSKTRGLRTSTKALLSFADRPSFPTVGQGLKRLHICIITKEFPGFASYGGIGTLYYHLASELLLMGHYVTVVMPAENVSPYRRGRFSIQPVKHHRVCTPDTLDATKFATKVDWSLSAFRTLAELHINHPVDIVEATLWDSEPLALALAQKGWRPPLVLRLVTPFPVAVRLNDWSLSDQEIGLFTAAEKALITKADAVVPISESIACIIENEYQLKRDQRWVKSHCGIAYWPFFHWTLNYAELTTINGKNLTIPAEARLILFLGRLEGRKGVDILLAAANQFLKFDSEAHLLLAGRDIEGWSQQATTVIDAAVATRVHFLGEVDDPTREKLLHAAYCVVFPSRYESFGLVPLEAFVHGVPVVASVAGAIPEVVEHEKCGLLFSPDDSDALANCVIRLLKEPQLREKLSIQAREQVRRFSSRNSAIRAVELYAKLLAGSLLKQKVHKTLADE